jgi:hypothetical protein
MCGIILRRNPVPKLASDPPSERRANTIAWQALTQFLINWPHDKQNSG